MKKRLAFALAVAVLGIVAAGYKAEPAAHNQTWKEHYAVVMPGETLWTKCQKYSGNEDIRTLIERVRQDNSISDPGNIQPGQKLIIRTRS